MLLPHLRRLQRPLLVAINKIDTVSKTKLLPLIQIFHQAFPAAITHSPQRPVGRRPDGAASRNRQLLPAGPPLYPPDQDTEASERFLAAEFIRERVLHHAREELPHAVAVAVEEFDESRRPELVRIRAVIYVERESQKAIIIGKQGSLLKAIGDEARLEIEALLGARVFLDLWVKVWKNWRRTPWGCAPWASRDGTLGKASSTIFPRMPILAAGGPKSL